MKNLAIAKPQEFTMGLKMWIPQRRTSANSLEQCMRTHFFLFRQQLPTLTLMPSSSLFSFLSHWEFLPKYWTKIAETITTSSNNVDSSIRYYKKHETEVSVTANRGQRSWLYTSEVLWAATEGESERRRKNQVRLCECQKLSIGQSACEPMRK